MTEVKSKQEGRKKEGREEGSHVGKNGCTSVEGANCSMFFHHGRTMCIIESQNCRVWRGPQEITEPSPPTKAGTPQ